MFVLDTNVVSELRKAKAGKADKNVTAWATTVLPGSLFLSAITILELETGAVLVERRASAQGAILRAWLDGHVLPAFCRPSAGHRYSGRAALREASCARSSRRT